MIEEILKLFAFFLLGIFYFYSVTGFGKLISNENSNFFDYQLDGTIILLLIGYFLYLSIGFNLFVNSIFFFSGVILYFFLKKNNSKIKLKYLCLLTILIFSVLLISKTHEDFDLYHYFTIYEFFNNKLRIGIPLLNGYFVHSSHLTLNQTLLILPVVGFKFIHLPIFIIYLSTIGYFTLFAFSQKSKKEELFFSILCILVLLVKFNRLSEFGYDYVSQFILLIVFHKIYFLYFDNAEIIKSILYFLLCVLIKPISLLFSPILLYIIYKKGFIFLKQIPLSKYLLFFLLILTIISSSFIKTGCIFYPLNKTCFEENKVFWSEKTRLKKYSEIVKLWSKSYDAQNESKYEKIKDKELYNKNFNWVKFWIEKHFFYKIFEFLLIIISLIFLILLYFSRSKSSQNNDYKDKIVIFCLSILSILFWFNTVPQFRFGFSSILIFIFFLFNLPFNFNINFNKKKFIHLFIFGILILNVKNFNRIDKEFKRNDFYKFSEFPFFNEKEVKYDYSNIARSKFYYVELLKYKK